MKAKDQNNLVFVCPICNKEFGSNRSLAAHKAWHTSGPRINPNDLMTAEERSERSRKGWVGRSASPKMIKHLEEARKNINHDYRMERVREAQDQLYLDSEWLAKKNKNIFDGHKTSKKAALQRHERSQKGAIAKMRTQLKYVYNGVKFRSTYEVRFAYVLDLLEIEWQYEPCWFIYSIDKQDRKYNPDFYLPELNVYIEVTGCMPRAKVDKLFAASKQNEIFLLVVDGIILESLDLNNNEIKFLKDNKTKLIYANTEPSQIRNDLEGVETTIESLRQQFFAMASKLHESLSANKVSGRYSPNLQETVRAEDKELQDNTNVIYCPYIPLFTTPTLITSDLMAQKGFLSSAGFKVINPGLFCRGRITHLGEGYQT